MKFAAFFFIFFFSMKNVSFSAALKRHLTMSISFCMVNNYEWWCISRERDRFSLKHCIEAEKEEESIVVMAIENKAFVSKNAYASTHTHTRTNCHRSSDRLENGSISAQFHRDKNFKLLSFAPSSFVLLLREYNQYR